MQEEIMLRKLQALPSDKQTEVIDCIDFLAKKSQGATQPQAAPVRGLYGRLNGEAQMSDDFQEPLPDFKS
jgi:hypothetical protein